VAKNLSGDLAKQGLPILFSEMFVSPTPPDLVEAFPASVDQHARAAISMMPAAMHPRSDDDIAPIQLNGQPLRIPSRIYNSELGASTFALLPVPERGIAACLYTRHHDGQVRQRALTLAIEVEEAWAAPFILHLLGEYVLEIVTIAAQVTNGPPREGIMSFLRENPGFLDLIDSRATSYWNEYYRQQFPDKKDYPGLIAIAVLRQWSQSK
jgi:hypothetical protein